MAVLFLLALWRAILTWGVPSAIQVHIATDTEVVLWVQTAECRLDLVDDPCYAYASLEDGTVVIETGP